MALSYKDIWFDPLNFNNTSLKYVRKTTCIIISHKIYKTKGKKKEQLNLNGRHKVKQTEACTAHKVIH